MRQHDVDPAGAVTVDREGRMGLRLDLKRMPFADKGVFKVGQQQGGTVIVVLLEKTEFFFTLYCFVVYNTNFCSANLT